MNIANLLGTSTSSALEAIYGQRKDSDEDNAARNSVHSWGRDRVSLSEAALALLEQAGKEQSPPEDSPSREDLAGREAAEQSGAATEETGESAAGGNPAAGGDSAASDIDAKIKAIMQKIIEIQNSSLPEDSKSAMISALQNQVSQLVQEKNALGGQAGKA